MCEPLLPIAAVVLAAGCSRRMGRPKATLPWGQEHTLLSRTLDTARAAGCTPLIVVSGAEREAVEAIAARYAAHIVFNPQYAAGQSSSLRCGLSAVPPGAAALFLLADQPAVSAQTLRRLQQAYQRSQAPIVVPRAPDGRRGTPCLFAPETFLKLRQLDGDQGGRSLIAAYGERVLTVDVDEDAVAEDIDTTDDYQRLLRKYFPGTEKDTSF